MRMGGGEEREWFESKVGLRQAWLLNIYMDGVVREVYATAERNGMNLVGVDGQGWELSGSVCRDTALVADSEAKMQKLVEEFGRVCKCE